MNEEENNVTDDNVEIVEAPKKKSKWLLGLGIFAVIATVAGTLVFANGGEWFKGMSFDMPNLEYEIQTPNIPNTTETTSLPTRIGSSSIYVDDNPSAASGLLSGYDVDIADGSKEKPYTKIELGIDALGTEGGILHVAEGTYTEEILIDDQDVDLIGSYNSSFTSTNLNSTPTIIKGAMLIKNSTGKVENFDFNNTQSSEAFTIKIDEIGTNDYQIENNKFENISKNHVIQIISGEFTQGSVKVMNNEFKNVSASSGSVIAAGSSITDVNVENNFMYDCYGQTAIVSVGDGDKVINNIISNSDEKSKVIIKVSESEVYNNTIAYNNNQPSNAFGLPEYITKTAIKSAGNSKIYNNLIVDKFSPLEKLQAFNTTSTDTLSYNAIYPESLEMHIRDIDSGVLLSCDPGFSKSSSADGYKLSSDSTCINNGKTVSSVNEDYFGTARPVGGEHDIGAYEYTVALFMQAVIPLEFTPHTPDLTPDGTPEICGDGIDNNSDGLIDCDDPLCTVACSTILEDEICTDGVDNDNDGDTDCDDSDCTTHTSCVNEDDVEEDQEICTNGIDDDGDGYVDCIDWDCSDHDFCVNDFVTPSDPETCDCNWSDLTDDFDGTAAKGLCEMGCIVGGYPDGTVRLNEKLNRAELLAIAFRASKYENIYDVNMNSDYCFNDVTSEADGHWFAPYICTAKTKGFVEGYDGNLAKPSNKVILAEALKMMLGALNEDYEVNNSGKWYIDMVLDAADENQLPYSAHSSSDADNVGAVELTRGKAFNMLYRILKY
jgi:S-layer homology domain